MIVRMTPFSETDPYTDELGRESFVFLTECPHGATIPVLVCSDVRTVREVADTTTRLANDACVHCLPTRLAVDSV